MALMDRVATLVRANLNDLLDKAENPEKMLKQVILDMENQFMQVKTQVAIALADLHLLEKKKTENGEKHAEWMHKAELAVDKKDDQLARAALERAVSFQLLADNYDRANRTPSYPGRVHEVGFEETGPEAVGGPRQGRLADRSASAVARNASRREHAVNCRH